MKQLGQLNQKKAEFEKLGVKLVAIFREERKGAAGTMQIVKKTGFSPILIDTPIRATRAYSQGGFSTYLIDKTGVIKAEISGTKYKRETGETILAKVKEVLAK